MKGRPGSSLDRLFTPVDWASPSGLLRVMGRTVEVDHHYRVVTDNDRVVPRGQAGDFARPDLELVTS